MRRFPGLFAALAVAACGASSGPDGPAGPPDPCDGRSLAETAGSIAGLGARPAGSAAEAGAAELWSREVEASGLAVESIPVPLPGDDSGAVFARLPEGADGPALVVGAHLDSLSGPGANDDAGGLAVLVGIAEALATEAPRQPVVLAAFGAEEASEETAGAVASGSRAFVSKVPGPWRGMISLDLVGLGDEIAIGIEGSEVGSLARELETAAATEGIPVRLQIVPRMSDHAPFLEAGVDAVWLFGADDPARHTEADTAERLEPEALERTCRLVLALVREDSGSTSP